jgi:oxygen-independent coproporphyrinogen III oxidase
MNHNANTLSLYIHIPFCVSKCRYCDFYSVTYNESLSDAFIDALLVEWELAKTNYSLENASIATLYFGGGTPSMLSLKQWEKIIKNFVQKLPLLDGYEWSIECNPDSFSAETARLWLDSGVTRLTFGVQSLIDGELTTLGRRHSSRRALEVLCEPVVGRFASIGVDLMYGLPWQTLTSLDASLTRLLSITTIKHLSAYELSVAANTPFGRHAELLRLPEDDEIAKMSELVKQKATASGLTHYEISNYALSGHQCAHNKAYWRHKPYLGLGPAAHSYLPTRRFSNVKNVGEYIARISARTLASDFTETLDVAAVAREMVLLGLRTAEGISEDVFRSMTGLDFASMSRISLLDKFVHQGMLIHTSSYWRPTDKGMLFADAMARDLI